MSFPSECSCRCFGVAPENSAKVKIRIEKLLNEGAEQKYLHSNCSDRKQPLCRFGELVNDGLCDRVALVFHSEYAPAEAVVIAAHNGKIEYWARQFETDTSGCTSSAETELVVFEDAESVSPEERINGLLASFDSPVRVREGWIRL